MTKVSKPNDLFNFRLNHRMQTSFSLDFKHGFSQNEVSLNVLFASLLVQGHVLAER